MDTYHEDYLLIVKKTNFVVVPIGGSVPRVRAKTIDYKRYPK